MIRHIVLLTLILISSGCAGSDEQPELAVPKPGYAVVFLDENVVIQEKILGANDTWNWDEFVMPEARIAFSDDYRMAILDKFDDCFDQFQTQESCTFSVVTPTDVYEFRFDKILAGNCEIYRNGKLIWTGQMNGGTSLSISSIIVLGNGLVIDYIDIDNQTSERSKLDTILSIENNSVIDYVLDDHYTSAFAPFELQGKIAFFAQKGGDLFLVVDGQETILDYDWIFNQQCCWDGPSIQISSNGETLDFFAQKDGGWYHVQVTKN